MRRLLADAKRDGVPFDDAWSAAFVKLDSTPEWNATLRWSRDSWQAAYEDRPDESKIGALAA